MKSFFAIAVLAASAQAFDDVWDDEHAAACHMDCNNKQNNDFALMHLEKSCEHYRYVMPRPTVYRFCFNAFNDGLESKCLLACDGILGHAEIENHAHQTCADMKNQVPRPLSYKACTDGYHAGAAAAREWADTHHVNRMANGGGKRSPENAKTFGQTPEEQAIMRKNMDAARDARRAEENGETVAPEEPQATEAPKAEAPKVETQRRLEDAPKAKSDLKSARDAARKAYAAEQARRKPVSFSSADTQKNPELVSQLSGRAHLGIDEN